MRRSKALPVSDLIYRFLREEGLESPLNEYRLIQAWESVLGKAISRYTGQMFIKNQMLHVHLTSPALRQDLQMSRKLLVQRLNDAVGAQVITDITFH
jgi:predicted nucleic acid-binding Zn ribbon protein